MNHIVQFWKWLRFRRRYRVVSVVDAADEIPDDLPVLGAVVVGSLEIPTWIAFDCPCRRGHRIMLNLDACRYPRWKLHKSVPVTLQPSIDSQLGDNRCHYIMCDGKIRWVPDLGVGRGGGAR